MTTPLRLLSYNIQVGIGTNGYHEYLTQSWRYLLPHREQHNTLDGIAALAKAFDLVGLQEVDGGSLRSRFINQTEFLAQRSGFPCWYSQTNRRLGNLAHHSLGALSRMPFGDVRE
ncbi:MAG: EEP domain-containing protein, partial [Gammaproteobacteria bacterium]|nr:EEP domain-containing protein [Gammaproteobacteria bacterium]